jgi:hypothetical protein
LIYPLRLVDDRSLPADYDGPVHVWDVDKTYLDTDISSVWGMLRIPLEMAIDKRTIPGAVAVLRECRRGPGPRPRHVPLYFVSASPPQLEGVIRRRMLLDGVEPDGFVFKDQLALALRESDALVFACLAAAQRGALSGDALAAALREAKVDDVDRLAGLAREAAGRATVATACVVLTRGRAPAAFDAFAPSVRATREALQLAVVLRAQGLLAADGLVRVARHLVDAWGWTRASLVESVADLRTRRLVGDDVLAEAEEAIRE